jgi:hypothetical protein
MLGREDPLLDAVCTEIGNVMDGSGLEGAGRLAKIAGIKATPQHDSWEVRYGNLIGYGFFMPQFGPDEKPYIPEVNESNHLGKGVCVLRKVDESCFGIYVARVSSQTE